MYVWVNVVESMSKKLSDHFECTMGVDKKRALETDVNFCRGAPLIFSAVSHQPGNLCTCFPCDQSRPVVDMHSCIRGFVVNSSNVDITLSKLK